MSGDLPLDVVELAPCPPASGRVPGLREIAFRADAWSTGEVDRLRELFAADEPFDAIAVDLGRGRAGVADKAWQLGLRRNSKRPWNELEDQVLHERYGKVAAADIAGQLGRSCAAVYVRAQLLELTEGNPPPWSEWEDAQLRAGYERAVPIAQLAALIGRPLGGVVGRAGHLGLRHPHKPADWSDAEAGRALELAHEGHRYLEIIRMLAAEGFPARTKSGFQQRLWKLGYGRGWGRDWMPDEDELLRRAYRAGESLTALGARIGRSRHSMKWRAEYLDLQGTHLRKAGWRGETWTPADEALLRAEFGRTPSPELARKLGRTKAAMFSRANTLGLQHGYIRMFSPDERRAIGIAWRLGLPLSTLAGALGRDPAVISKQAIRLGIAFDRADRPVQPSRGVRKAGTQPLTLPNILALLPPDPAFDEGLEAAASEREQRASRNRSAGASTRARAYRQSIGLSA